MSDFREAMRSAVRGHLTSVYVPGLEWKVWIRQLSVKDALKIEDAEPDDKLRALRLAAASIVDENGEAEITSDEDFDLFMDLPLAAIMPIMLEAGKQNGQTREEIEKAVEGFRSAQGEDSSSG